MARNAMPTPDVSAVSAFRRQLATPPNEDCGPSSSRHPSLVKTSPSERSPCPICKQPFSVYREGPRGWNTKPFTLCIDCFRTRRRNQRRKPPPPTSSAITDCSRTLDETGHLRAIMTTSPSPLEEQAEISLQESRRSDNAHYVFQDGHWMKAGMRAHPLITVCVSTDKSWCRTRHGPIVARNVPAIADTGAQTNVWLLLLFLAAGFDRSILIPASDLVAANYSGINIVGAFLAVIKGLDANKTEVQCHAMIYVSADVSHLYLSQATLADLGVLSPQFPMIGEHPPLETHNQDCVTQPPTIPIRSMSGGCSSLSQPTDTCTCPQRTAVPPPPSSLPFPCTPENKAKMRPLPSTLARIALYIVWLDPHSKSTLIPWLSPWHVTFLPPSPFTGNKRSKMTYFVMRQWEYWKKCHMANLHSGAIARSLPGNMMDLPVALWTCHY